MEIELFNVIFDGLLGGLGNAIIVFALVAIAGITFTLSALRLDPLFALLAASFPFIIFALYASVEIFAIKFVVIFLLSIVAAISIARLLFR